MSDWLLALYPELELYFLRQALPIMIVSVCESLELEVGPLMFDSLLYWAVVLTM
jgi:hypothetical protein